MGRGLLPRAFLPVENAGLNSLMADVASRLAVAPR